MEKYWKWQKAPLERGQCCSFKWFLGQKIVVVSKRGRSHANVGSFRDDDFAFKTLTIQVEYSSSFDGAGSASLSREGSNVLWFSD
jgi:hypothetical protein